MLVRARLFSDKRTRGGGTARVSKPPAESGEECKNNASSHKSTEKLSLVAFAAREASRPHRPRRAARGRSLGWSVEEDERTAGNQWQMVARDLPAARSFTLSFTPHVGNRFSCLAPRPQFTHLRVGGSKTCPPKHKVTSWSDAVGEGGERGGAQVHCK